MRLIRLFRRDLAHEARDWVKKGLINEQQAQSICHEYNIDYSNQSDHSFVYGLLLSLGYLFIGLALLTIIGANWDEIPRALRMWSLITLTAVLHSIGCWHYSQDNKSKAKRFFMLGNFSYGCSIVLIAQIYSLGEHMPDGIFWWAFGSLPFALLLRSSYLMLFSLLLSILWLLVETHMGFYPTLFPVFILASLWILVKGKGNLFLFLSTLLGIGLWIAYSLAHVWRDGLQYHFQAEHIFISSVLFCLVYVFGHWLNHQNHASAKDYGALLGLWCLRFALIVLVILSFKDPWAELITANWEHTRSMYLIGAILSAITLYIAYQIDRLKTTSAFLLGIFILSFIVIFSLDRTNAIHLQIISNLVLLSVGIGLVIKGIRHGVSHYFYLGIVTILGTAFLRYVDLVANYIGGAMLFMVFAGILIGAAQYWKYNQSGGQ